MKARRAPLPNTAPRRAIPAPRPGVLHIVDAAGYSLAGFGRLMRETAARLEMIALCGGATLLALHGASLWQGLIFAGLAIAVLVVEALNTAIEVLTDRVSPEWSQAAKHAKDLGSLAVGLTLTFTGAYLGLMLCGALGN